MELIDTHCHLDATAFDADRTAVLARSAAAGVGTIVIPGITAAGWPGLLALTRTPRPPGTPVLYPALGLHPVYLEHHGPDDLTTLERQLGETRPLAIGEIGLDHAVAGLDLTRQQTLLAAQLAIARSAALPVLLHVRKAHDAVLALLRRQPVCGGIVHAFNGSLQQGLQYHALGLGLGFGGMLTFTRSTRLRRLARELPLAALVLETDAPDLTVAAHRGERNSPEYLPDILHALAAARGLDAAEVAACTSANARQVLGLP